MYPHRGVTVAPKPAATLGDYLDAIYRRRWWILALVVLSVGAAFAVTKRLPRMYDGMATLDIERMTPSGLVGPELSTQVAPDMDQVVATHMRMIQSDAVLRPIAVKYDLFEPGASERRGPVRLKNLKITRPPSTYLIQISFRAPKPELAANVANAIARNYLAQLQQLQRTQWETLSVATRRQLAELKDKMESSNEALLVFQRQIGMVDPEDKTNVLAARLIQLNTEFAKAQSDRAAKEAVYDTLVSGSPEAAEASTQGEQVKRLLERRSEAQQKFADVKTIYGDRNAEYKRAAAQLQDIDAQIRVAYNKVIKRAEAELRETRLRESNLSAAYSKTKQEADAVSARAVEYRLLRQRADSDRIIYDELSRKVGEAEINSGLRAAPVRIADLASPDSHPASPSAALNCAIALLGSLLIGCVAAVIHDVRRERFRTADDIRAACGAEVVTVLPTVRSWRGRNDTLAEGHYQRPDADVLRFREQIKRLRNAFNQAMGSDLPRVIVVVSPSRRDGRSRIASEFGLAYSALGQRTLIMDADLRNPVRRRTRPAAGLSSALSGEARWRDAVLAANGSIAPDVLPSGPQDDRVSELVHKRLDFLVDEAARDYDVVVIDSPPFLRYSECLDIVRNADAVIVVARAGHTEPREFETMLRYLRRMNARVGAVVLNDVERA
ncbi:MAG: polysaccharide biosynthesis tyrosine autokinase [Acidobacteria bacterium]|nr:polysaccharide biosynthesis tyrosine autokinase [Acidobacteriota bacterium]